MSSPQRPLDAPGPRSTLRSLPPFLQLPSSQLYRSSHRPRVCTTPILQPAWNGPTAHEQQSRSVLRLWLSQANFAKSCRGQAITHRGRHAAGHYPSRKADLRKDRARLNHAESDSSGLARQAFGPLSRPKDNKQCAKSTFSRLGQAQV